MGVRKGRLSGLSMDRTCCPLWLRRLRKCRANLHYISLILGRGKGRGRGTEIWHRLYGLGFHLFGATCVLCRFSWVGPTEDEDIQKAFDSIFNRSQELSGNCFFVAEKRHVQADVLKRLTKRGVVYKENSVDSEALTPELVEQMLPANARTPSRELLFQMLPPGHVQRLEAYEGLQPERAGIEDGSFICDLQQWPVFGCSNCGRFFPCQLTHGAVTSLNSWRIAVGLEHLVAQGFHVLPAVMNKYTSPMAPCFEEMPSDTVKALSGNSMSLPALSAWILFVLSNVAPAEPEAYDLPRRRFFTRSEENLDDGVESESSEEAEDGHDEGDHDGRLQAPLSTSEQDSQGEPTEFVPCSERSSLQKGSSAFFC